MCKGDLESVDHLLLHCWFARALWGVAFICLGISWVPIILLAILGRYFGSKIKECRLGSSSLVLEHMKERNQRVFKGYKMSLEQFHQGSLSTEKGNFVFQLLM